MQWVLLSCILKDLQRTWYHVFRKHLIECVIKVIWNFLFQEALDYKFYLFNEYRNIHCIYYIINTSTLHWSLQYIYIYEYIYYCCKYSTLYILRNLSIHLSHQIYDNIVVHKIVVSRILRPPLALNYACLFIISSPVNISIVSMTMLHYTVKGTLQIKLRLLISWS